MATTTVGDRSDDKAPPPKHPHRDEYEHLETLDHLGLVRDIDETLTPIDFLFNTKEATPKPKAEPRHIL